MKDTCSLGACGVLYTPCMAPFLATATVGAVHRWKQVWIIHGDARVEIPATTGWSLSTAYGVNISLSTESWEHCTGSNEGPQSALLLVITSPSSIDWRLIWAAGTFYVASPWTLGPRMVCHDPSFVFKLTTDFSTYTIAPAKTIPLCGGQRVIWARKCFSEQVLQYNLIQVLSRRVVDFRIPLYCTLWQ